MVQSVYKRNIINGLFCPYNRLINEQEYSIINRCFSLCKELQEDIRVEEKRSHILIQVLRGALIGLGAVLPGVSGGVLCVIFGLYKPIMEVLADPFHGIKKHILTDKIT